MATKKPRKKKQLKPLPEGVEVGQQVKYYLKGWRVGQLREVKGNDVAIIPIGTYGHDTNKHAKWVAITDIQKMD